MPLSFHRRFLFHAGFVLVTGLAVGEAAGQTPAVLPPPLPAPAPTPSPVAYFRQLLAASPPERDRLLAGKSPQQLRVLTNGIRTYLGLPEAEREVRLRTMELRSYLAPLLRVPPADRGERLKAVPGHYRDLVQERLAYWDRLPASVQQQVLADEKASRVGRIFVETRPLPPAPPLPGTESAGGLNAAMEPILAPWRATTPARQQEVITAFTNLFDLPPALKGRALDPLPLSPSERDLMERALETFRRMKPAQRQACVNGFKKFAELSPTERVQFFKNAEAWQKMTPEDRQRWRILVERMPEMPPLPPGFNTPVPPPLPRTTASPNSSLHASNSPSLR